MPKAYSYVRFSTPEQAGGDSLDRQLRNSMKWAARNGYELDTSHRDPGISAFRSKNLEKGSLGAFLKLAEAGEIEAGSVLILENMDRLSRAPILESTDIFRRVLQAGVDVVTLTDGIVHRAEEMRRNPYAYMLPVMSLSLANAESTKKSERLSESWAMRKREAVRSNRPLTTTCPAWLRPLPEHKGFEVIADRAEIINRIFQMAASGFGRRKIATALNKEEIPTWGGWHGKRSAHGWRDSYIIKILTNPSVLGDYQPHKYVDGTNSRGERARVRIPDGPLLKGYYPQIVSHSLWEKFHTQRPTMAPGPKSRRVANLFSGLLFDGYTAEKMEYVDKSSKRSPRARGHGQYVRSDAKRLGRTGKTCSWPYPHLEGLLLHFLREVNWEALAKEGEIDEPNEDLEHAAKLRGQIVELKDRISTLLEEFKSETNAALRSAVRDSLSRDAERQTELEAELSVVEKRIKAQRANTTPNAGSEIEAFKVLVADAKDPDARLRLQCEIRRRVNRIELFPRGEAVYQPGWPRSLPDLPCVVIHFKGNIVRAILTTLPKRDNYDRHRRDKRTGRILPGMNPSKKTASPHTKPWTGVINLKLNKSAYGNKEPGSSAVSPLV